MTDPIRHESDIATSASWRHVVESVGFVAVWMALGFACHMSTTAYLLAGVPLTAVFQLAIRRKPLRQLWVTSAPPFSVSIASFALFLLFAAVPSVGAVRAIAGAHWSSAGWNTAGIVGAAAAAYAVAHARRATAVALVRCWLIAGGTGTATMLIAAFVRVHLFHVLFAFDWRTAALSFARYWAVAFVLEEVSFRGAVDAHLCGGIAPHAARAGMSTALLSGALWGLWHLPIVSLTPIAIPGFIVLHATIGVPLALYFRRSGNLAVPVFAHAFIDAIRNGLGLHG